jgi:hypothetical protein
MILLSNGGTNIQRAGSPSDTIVVGTVDGIALLRRGAQGWSVAGRALEGCFVSAVTELHGVLFAATHGIGVARSTDGGHTWAWTNDGLSHFDLWSARAGSLLGRDVVLVGSLPAHLYVSHDNGTSWCELPALRRVPSVAQWCFPPPPHIGHVKDIVIESDRLLVGIEIGALLVSDDGGESFSELRVDPDPVECDIHRIVTSPLRPQRIIVANGMMGPMTSEDAGLTWRRNPVPPDVNYPDAIVIHPDQPDLVFMTAAAGWPLQWVRLGRARGKIVRSRDAGNTWERLLGGLPDGQRALFSALSIEACDDAYGLYAADTDGQVFESRDGGDTWSIIADIAAVSKGEFYRALEKNRSRLADVDDIVIADTAAKRFASAS